MAINPELLLMARHAARQHEAKSAHAKVGFVPSDMAAQGGGGGPPAGGSPSPTGGGPGGPPPSGPPSGGGGAPPTPSGPDMATMLQPMIQQAVQQALAGQGGGGGMGGPGMGAAGKPPKPDINMVASDTFQMKKLMFAFFRQMGWEPPADILDGPGRDPTTGLPAASPMGGSDPSVTPGSPMGNSPAPIPSPGDGGGPGGPGALGGDQGGSAIPPMQPMEGASPALAQNKAASWQARNDLLYRYAAYDLEQIHGMLKQAEQALLRLTGDDPRIGEVVSGQRVVNKAAALAKRFSQKRQQNMREALPA